MLGTPTPRPGAAGPTRCHAAGPLSGRSRGAWHPQVHRLSTPRPHSVARAPQAPAGTPRRPQGWCSGPPSPWDPLDAHPTATRPRSPDPRWLSPVLQPRGLRTPTSELRTPKFTSPTPQTRTRGAPRPRARPRGAETYGPQRQGGSRPHAHAARAPCQAQGTVPGFPAPAALPGTHSGRSRDTSSDQHPQLRLAPPQSLQLPE